jgi:hypothetical protein
LRSNQAKEFLTNVGTAHVIGGTGNGLQGAPKHQATRDGTAIYPSVLQSIQQNGSSLVLVDGRCKTEKPLVLEVWQRNKKDVAFRTKLPLSLDGVEQMFRHKNLVEAGGGPPINPVFITNTEDRLNEPTNYPDRYTNNKNFVYLHGYNVNEQQARGWQADLFKRLYWSGSNAKFWGITWYGAETQLLGSVTVDYHRNVIHAFDTAPILKDFLNYNVPGDITIAAHSLGNMLASAVLTDYKNVWESNGKIKYYFMLDAAVAKEAYDGTEGQDTEFSNIDFVSSSLDPVDCSGICMDHPDWKGYDDRLYASEWYKLFENDNRSKLTWRDRFRDRPNGTVYYNLYSSGEEVLGGHKGIPSILDTGMIKQTGRYTWALQEKLKGRMYIDFDFVGSELGGWGINPRYIDYSYIDPFTGRSNKAFSAQLMNTQLSDDAFKVSLRTTPFFSTSPEDAVLFSEATGSAEAAKKAVRDKFLAMRVPARTLPIGANPSKAFDDKHNIDMQSKFKNNWPAVREYKNWRHGD